MTARDAAWAAAERSTPGGHATPSGTANAAEQPDPPMAEQQRSGAQDDLSGALFALRTGAHLSLIHI